MSITKVQLKKLGPKKLAEMWCELNVSQTPAAIESILGRNLEQSEIYPAMEVIMKIVPLSECLKTRI
jgi:hypothetical protein